MVNTLARYSLYAWIVICTVAQVADSSATAWSYGVDCSFPVHNKDVTKCKDLLGDRQTFYEGFMDGCRKIYGKSCDRNEERRIESSLLQPRSVKNHTVEGFAVSRAPEIMRDAISHYWTKNKSRMTEEKWPKGTTDVNHWASPTYHLGIDENNLRGGKANTKILLQRATQHSVEEWIGAETIPRGAFGIRVHTRGAVIAPHVERQPLHVSAIVNVDQDLDSDWVYELYRRDGGAVNVTLKPGDMLMFESGSMIHGRPFPLEGRFSANLFFHFEPVLSRPVTASRYSAPNAIRGRRAKKTSSSGTNTSRLPVPSPTGGAVETTSNGMPSVHWDSKTEAVDNKEEALQVSGTTKKRIPLVDVDSPKCHIAAANGDFETVSQFALNSKTDLVKRDSNGWEPIHEAARSGHLKVLELLIENGADVNSISNFGSGYSPLRIAKYSLNDDHSVLRYLQSLGAIDHGPEL